jgi:hypothetical protein
MNRHKQELVKNYLNQQAENVFLDRLLDPDALQIHRNLEASNISVQDEEDEYDEDEFERFKAIVKFYSKTDNEIKEIKSKVRLLNLEIKKRKETLEKLSGSIMSFMAQNEIDELNSKQGVIRYKTSVVKAPLTTKKVKEELYDKLSQNSQVKSILDKVFEERDKVEKKSLTRIAH